MEYWQLKQRQSLPLEAKIVLSQQRIKDWYGHWGGQVYVSFSGGKDSTVLLHLVRQLYPNVPAVFSDTGLEYPEIRDFVKTVDNVVWVKPEMTFKEVLDTYGYPVISKKVARSLKDLQNASSRNEDTVNLRMTGYTKTGRYCPSMKLAEKWKPLADAPFKISDTCCDIMKKRPIKKYIKKTGRKPIIGTMAEESKMREKSYLTYGCNAFDLALPMSSPLAFWTNNDILEYLKTKNIPYCEIYGDIILDDEGNYTTTREKRTGCMFCMFGVHLEKGENRFQRMKRTHPKIHQYCMEKLGLKKVLDYIDVASE